MKTICILTFGTSDLQFNKKELPEGYNIVNDKEIKKLEVTSNGLKITVNLEKNRSFEEWYLLHWCRDQSKIILDNINVFIDVIRFPLTIPLIEIFQSENRHIDKFILVYTDQTDDSKFKARDTLFVAEIFKKVLINRFNYREDDFIGYSIREKVTDYDYQFIKIGEDCKKLIPFSINEIGKVYLLPQGGIDQINTTLTLQLLKCYGFKVEIWQKKENDQPKQIRFAELYLRDLTFDHILTLVSKGDYAGGRLLLKTIDSVNYLNLDSLLKFGDLKINARFEDINSIGRRSFEKELVPEPVKEAKNEVFWCNDDIKRLFDGDESDNKKYLYKVSEYFEIASFFNKPESRNRFVMAFQVFVEAFLNYYLSIKTNCDIVSGTGSFEKDSDKIVALARKDAKVKEVLNSEFRVNYNGITILSMPVSLAMALTYSEHNEVIKLLCKTNGKYKECVCNLDDLRNNLAHRGKGISEDEFKKISALFNEISKYFTYRSSSSFDDLNDEIRRTIDGYRKKLK